MIVVFAPVHQRGWILRDWFECLANQEELSPDNLHVLLNYGASDDDTLAIIQEEASRGRFAAVEYLEDSGTDHVASRTWTLERYQTMVRLRNDLLDRVRKIGPDFALSCDTDMLLPPQTLRTLLAELQDFGGIAPLTFMTETSEQFPNCMTERWVRVIPQITSPRYAVFGVVLMTSKLYSLVSYSTNPMGEDLGWAANVRDAGITLAICPHVRVKHVMSHGRLGEIDVRIGF